MVFKDELVGSALLQLTILGKVYCFALITIKQ